MPLKGHSPSKLYKRIQLHHNNLQNLFCIYRLQAAKQKAEAIFKDIPLGESIRKTVPSSFRRKRVRDGEEGSEMKRLSRLDKAKAETLEAFGGSTLESLSKRQKKQKIVYVHSSWFITCVHRRQQNHLLFYSDIFTHNYILCSILYYSDIY